jgi:ADP-ribose pyrophosphatase YjhB (NUDIX family)
MFFNGLYFINLLYNKMVGASILPVAIHNNELHFLFGKENKNEKSSPGYSDFGGKCEDGESIYQAALREGAEELTGFLGNENALRKMIRDNGGYYKISTEHYHVHIFLINYDHNLPTYFNNNHNYLWKQTNHSFNKHLFEKIEIQWFTISDMQKNRSKFRNFYKKIVDIIIGNKTNILKYFS